MNPALRAIRFSIPCGERRRVPLRALRCRILGPLDSFRSKEATLPSSAAGQGYLLEEAREPSAVEVITRLEFQRIFGEHSARSAVVGVLANGDSYGSRSLPRRARATCGGVHLAGWNPHRLVEGAGRFQLGEVGGELT